MENISYTSSQIDVINYIQNINKNYELWIDFKEDLRYIDSEGMIIKQTVLNPLKVSYSDINPVYKIYRRSKYICIIKIIIPEFTIVFPNLHNLTYTFRENSLDLHISLLNFTVEFKDIESYFDDGLQNYLKRTIDSIMSQKFIADNGYRLECDNYKTYVYGINIRNKKRKSNLTYIY